ncbi:MAG: sigma-70 family RNA polymerase sigma factor [Bacteroidota bacterium]
MKKNNPNTTISPSQRPRVYRLWNINDKRVINTDTHIKNQSVSEIIEGCKKKKTRFQKLLYYRYCDELYTSAYRIIKENHMAEDALHDAFLLIFRDIKKLKNNDSLRAWMKRVVINTSLKMLQRHRKIEYTDKAMMLDSPQSLDPMNGEHIYRAISLLPEGYRVVFLLVEVEGYKHAEVAEMLGISEGTSKSQLHYAKLSLKKMLNG